MLSEGTVGAGRRSPLVRRGEMRYNGRSLQKKEGLTVNKWKVIAPLALTAAGALAAGLASLRKKPEDAAPAAAQSAPAAPGKLVTGVYSFISGYKNPATVELTLQFDPERGSFAVIAEDFLSYSSASHVAVYEDEDLQAQIEYVPYYTGEDFEGHTKALAEKYADLRPAAYAALKGVRYTDGDTICLCFPIPGDASSCVLFTLFRVKKDDKHPLEALPDCPPVRALLDSARIEVRH